MARKLSIPTPKQLSLAGQKVVCFARADSTKDVDRQLGFLNGAAHMCGVEVVATVAQANFTPSELSDDNLKRLIRLKRKHKNFSILLMTDLSRLTRLGGARGIQLSRRLAEHGIKIAFIGSIGFYGNDQ